MMLPEDFTIHIAELKNGTRRIQRDIPLAFLAAELAHCEYEVTPVQAHCDLVMQWMPPENVLLTGKINAVVKTPCSTCLTDVELHLCADIDALLAPISEQVINDDAEYTPEDLHREYYENEQIALDDLIRDGIMLELPMTPRCTGPCKRIKGLVTAQEAEEKQQKIDPRLARLAEFKLS
ncbi:MAG: DUF177 domain-containing protein [Proteobacteria bacterium]|nr:DUF177 domain-containing protein [Pseudomonadota bacterium]